jgi:hypothetical protein
LTTHFSDVREGPFRNPFPRKPRCSSKRRSTFHQFRGKSGHQKLTSAALRQAAAHDISANHRLFIKAAAKRRREETVRGTTYSGDGGMTPGAWPARETLAPIRGSELNDSKGYVKKNVAHPETFSEIFEGLEFK